ncbi:CIA30 family protein [Pseudorhodobacter ferrugineus]|uniref:CIA30 family protein n=1 Tax=Pseudorhodobacter ferrugineus TaxID=77008 RepID=UPI0003B64BF3|nr:CIA30 family protein [Pseudorhodobacter ferrugineus]
MELNPKWEYVADGVMGGVSRGGMQEEMFRGRMATVLRGGVSLDNNGGFVQIAFDLCHDGAGFDASDWDGIELETCGNGERYDIRLRTDQLTRPWQSFRSDFIAAQEWRSHRVAFDAVEAHKTDARFDPAHLRRIGILAIGREFQAEVAVANIRLYRSV